MFCIAAFIIFGILGIFSVRYRALAKKAWGCVWKKITFKPCDINIQEEMKSRLIGKYVLTRPRLAKFIDRFVGVFAWAFVILSVWSLFVVVNSGLNLFVYDTCNPDNPESCSLSGGGCGINSGKPGFWPSLKHGQILTWTKDEILTFGETVGRIPNRLKTWSPNDYVSEINTYYKPFEEDKLIALEIIDPSCKFCAKLFSNIKESGFDNKYNLTYLVYPIPDTSQPNGYRFPHSKLIATFLEAVKLNPLKNSKISADWQILEKIFTEKDTDSVLFQIKFNTVYSEQEAKSVIVKWLMELGYSDNDIAKIVILTSSEEVKNRLEKQKEVVENKIKTIKIPTIIFDGRRYDRAVGPEKLN